MGTVHELRIPGHLDPGFLLRGVLGVLESQYPVLPLLAPKILRLTSLGHQKLKETCPLVCWGGGPQLWAW